MKYLWAIPGVMLLLWAYSLGRIRGDMEGYQRASNEAIAQIESVSKTCRVGLAEVEQQAKVALKDLETFCIAKLRTQ